jgi:tricarballylate dehydrogenase
LGELLEQLAHLLRRHPDAGVAIVPTTAQVIDTSSEPIPGLYAAGEIVGGLFYFGYPGGTGLMAGSVFGRTAGHAAARGIVTD